MYHAILINKQFTDENYPDSLNIFAKKKDGDWQIFGVEVEDSELDGFIAEVQQNIKPGKWYAHIYNDEDLLVVFKEKVISVKPHESSWKPVIEYGRLLDIPDKQLDFWPNRFQDERHYFMGD